VPWHDPHPTRLDWCRACSPLFGGIPWQLVHPVVAPPPPPQLSLPWQAFAQVRAEAFHFTAAARSFVPFRWVLAFTVVVEYPDPWQDAQLTCSERCSVCFPVVGGMAWQDVHDAVAPPLGDPPLLEPEPPDEAPPEEEAPPLELDPPLLLPPVPQARLPWHALAQEAAAPFQPAEDARSSAPFWCVPAAKVVDE
jgi:hypothetical protein